MKRILALGISLALSWSAWAQVDHQQEIAEWQTEINQEFRSKRDSPLTKRDRKQFSGLDFFPISEDFRFQARFVRTPGQLPFQMTTTTGQKPVYEKYGEIHFTYQDVDYKLDVFQGQNLRHLSAYADHLFLPFLDATNGFDSYGGGRYLELLISQIQDDHVVIDFNKAYNPYCAYNDLYSCPLVPEQNYLDFRVAAGVKAFEGH
ncbi:MAG: DUF1684 domain-containing protein [Bacteroidota bacterium]